MKFNLASGTDIRDGWINFDIVPKWPLANRGCDVIWDARKDIIPYANDSAEEIYAGYLLLHLAPRYHRSVLSEIRRVLSPGGILMIGEVDMDIVMKKYIEDPSNHNYSQLIWGEQGDVHGENLADFDKHCQGFTESSLKKTLTEAGFTDLQRVKIFCDAVYYELTITCRK